MKTALGIRHVTPEIIDRFFYDFWDRAMKLGPEQISVLDGIEFKSLLSASKEWHFVWEGIMQEVSVSSAEQMNRVTGALHMVMRMGILIGLETAADPVTQAAQLGFSIGVKTAAGVSTECETKLRPEPGLRCNHCGHTYPGVSGPCPKCGKNTAQKLIRLDNARSDPS